MGQEDLQGEAGWASAEEGVGALEQRGQQTSVGTGGGHREAARRQARLLGEGTRLDSRGGFGPNTECPWGVGWPFISSGEELESLEPGGVS